MMNDSVNHTDSNRNSLSAVNIDCYGRSALDQVCLEHSGRKWNFIFDSDRKKERGFVAAMFLDRAILNPRVIYRYPKPRRFVVLWESPKEPHFKNAIQIKDRVRTAFTHDYELLALGDPFQRLDYSVSWVNDGIPMENANKTKLVSFFGSIQHPSEHGYEFRKAVANKYVPDPRVDCFGKGIKELEFKVSGIVPYCFSIAMENTQKDYYYTEKLIDCFVGKTVPIYWGCDRIGDVFDERGIIRFQTLEELETIIKGLSFAKYEQMRPYIEENARRVVEGRMGSYQDLYGKLAELMEPMINPEQPLPWIQRSKAAAALRYLGDSLKSGRLL